MNIECDICLDEKTKFDTPECYNECNVKICNDCCRTLLDCQFVFKMERDMPFVFFTMKCPMCRHNNEFTSHDDYVFMYKLLSSDDERYTAYNAYHGWFEYVCILFHDEYYDGVNYCILRRNRQQEIVHKIYQKYNINSHEMEIDTEEETENDSD